MKEDKEKRIRNFRRRCIRAAEKACVGEVEFYEDKGGVFPNCEFEDDGTLHIRRDGLRACFDVSNCQNDSAEVQDVKIKAVMKAMRLAVKPGFFGPHPIEEDKEFCPHCGKEIL